MSGERGTILVVEDDDATRGFLADNLSADGFEPLVADTELRARVVALLRRADRRPRLGRLRVGDLEVDSPSREVWLRGRRIALSQKESSLLRALATGPTRVFTKEELLRTVWGYRSIGNRLRKGIQRTMGRDVIASSRKGSVVELVRSRPDDLGP